MQNDVLPIANKFARMNQLDPRIKEIENLAYDRTQIRPQDSKGYVQLLHWRQKYRELDIRSISPNLSNFPLDRLENVDEMYEYWVMFELLYHLRLQGAIIELHIRSAQPHAIIKIEGKAARLFHQKGYRRYETTWAIDAKPDFSLEHDDKLLLVMDAKNWAEKDQSEAVYKMLGYMNNLDANKGVLFFSRRKESDIFYGQFEGAGRRFHLNQHLFNCCMRPSEEKAALAERANNLSILADIIRKALVSLGE